MQEGSGSDFKIKYLHNSYKIIFSDLDRQFILLMGKVKIWANKVKWCCNEIWMSMAVYSWTSL